MVYVLTKEGKALMPTERHGKIRRMLKNGRATVVKAKPFTIQLTYDITEYAQPVTLGIDAGYQNIGFSAITEKQELLAGGCNLLQGQVERNKERAMYRKQRRNRLRHRKSRFDNRKKPDGWLAPSIQNKLDTHVRLVKKISVILPLTKVIVEVASFDIQAIKNPGLSDKEYQEGEQKGFWNLREYILHRDGHQCQAPGCKGDAKELVLHVHHIGYWKGDRTNRPGNLITLCDKCHKPENHKQGNFLCNWQPKVKSFKAETFMSVVRWKLVNTLSCEHTYGYITKSRRIELGLEKSHANDAFCVAGGSTQSRVVPIIIQQVRRNSRSLQKFYDAKYLDMRTGEKVSGQTLNCGRTTRNKNLNTENLRKHRGMKVSSGRVSIRKRRYPFQPGDTVLHEGQKHTVKGVQNLGAYIKLSALSKPVKTTRVQLLYYGKGLRVG